MALHSLQSYDAANTEKHRTQTNTAQFAEAMRAAAALAANNNNNNSNHNQASTTAPSSLYSSAQPQPTFYAVHNLPPTPAPAPAPTAAQAQAQAQPASNHQQTPSPARHSTPTKYSAANPLSSPLKNNEV